VESVARSRKLISSSAVGVEDVVDYLGRLGVLLETDRTFPSITGIMVREPIKGSWWSHPMANEIYLLSQRLVQHPDTIFLKLLSGKTTYVHRRLWPELIAIGTAQDSWQFEGLPASAKSMLKKVEARGSLRLDEVKGARTAKEKGADAHALELRLLVFAEDIHTASGTHTKKIETWEHWAWRTGFRTQVLPSPERAKEEFWRIMEDLNAQFGAAVTLPWQPEKLLRRHRVKA
jgi:hypothetical protein